MNDLQIPHCPTCKGSGCSVTSGAHHHGTGSCQPCPDCNGSGHHPDTIEQLTSILEGGFDIGPVTAKIITITLLDALTGGTR